MAAKKPVPKEAPVARPAPQKEPGEGDYLFKADMDLRAAPPSISQGGKIYNKKDVFENIEGARAERELSSKLEKRAIIVICKAYAVYEEYVPRPAVQSPSGMAGLIPPGAQGVNSPQMTVGAAIANAIPTPAVRPVIQHQRRT